MAPQFSFFMLIPPTFASSDYFGCIILFPFKKYNESESIQAFASSHDVRTGEESRPMAFNKFLNSQSPTKFSSTVSMKQ